MNRQNKEDIKMPYSMRLKNSKQDVEKRKPRIVTLKPLSESIKNETKPTGTIMNRTKVPKMSSTTFNPTLSANSTLSSTESILSTESIPATESVLPTESIPATGSVLSTQISPQSIKTPSPLFIRYSRPARFSTEVASRTVRLIKRSSC